MHLDPPHTSSPLAGQGPHCLLLPPSSSLHLLPAPPGCSYLAGCTKRAVRTAEPAGESAKHCKRQQVLGAGWQGQSWLQLLLAARCFGPCREQSQGLSCFPDPVKVGPLAFLFPAMSQGLAEGQSFSPVLQKHPYRRNKAGCPITVLLQDLLSP